ncbi:MAG: shikimate kinase [Chitinophagaceae bacterium]|nr:shikimate kinase [Chitinophagaceae bacterium]
MRIFLIGFMGSGKTHWGGLVADRLKLPFQDLDTIIVEAEGQSIADIFQEKGEEHFRLQERDILRDIIHKHPSLVLSCGGGTPCFFNNIDLMKKEGTVVWLNSSIEALTERLQREKAHRPLIKDISDEELRSFILKKMNDRRLYYEQADVHVEEASADIDSLLQQILHV